MYPQRNLSLLLIGLVLAFIILPSLIQAQEVGNILRSPGSFVHEKVTVEGFVNRLLKEGGRTTEFYVLKDDFGKEINVRSTESYPKGRHVKETKKRIADLDEADIKKNKDDKAFQEAENAKTVKAYEFYVKSNPGGLHFKEAKDKIKIMLSIIPEMVSIPAGEFMMG